MIEPSPTTVRYRLPGSHVELMMHQSSAILLRVQAANALQRHHSLLRPDLQLPPLFLLHLGSQQYRPRARVALQHLEETLRRVAVVASEATSLPEAEVDSAHLSAVAEEVGQLQDSVVEEVMPAGSLAAAEM
jgi:hypothetical protein